MATLTQGQVYAIAVAAGLPQPKVMAAIAMAESSGRTDVVNGIGATGLWQINQPVHVQNHPTWTKAWLKNPVNNAAAAKVILKEQGLGAWEAYTGPDGAGSDGPWKKFYSGTITETPVDTVGLEDIPGVSTLGGIEAIGEATMDTANWIANPVNWVRVLYVVGGSVLVVVGLALLAPPSVVASALPSARIVSAVKKVAK